MPSTTWTTEIYPGGSSTYNDPAMAYDQNTDFEESGIPKYDTVGDATVWTLEAQ